MTNTVQSIAVALVLFLPAIYEPLPKDVHVCVGDRTIPWPVWAATNNMPTNMVFHPRP